MAKASKVLIVDDDPERHDEACSLFIDAHQIPSRVLEYS
jgi:hypothetical protein